jgi:hypothetical protein
MFDAVGELGKRHDVVAVAVTVAVAVAVDLGTRRAAV